MKAELSITKNDDLYNFALQGISGESRETRSLAELNEAIQIARRWITKNVDDFVAERLSINKTPHKFVAQDLKNYLISGGSYIYENLLPQRISSNLKEAEVKYLYLNIDDSLVDIPWELMNDGEEFFCLKYALGRRVPVKRSQDPYSISKEDVRFLLIEDPTGSLPASRDEIDYLIGGLLRLPGVRVRRGGMELSKKDFLNALNRGNFDILHFSGHGFFDPENPQNSSLIFMDNPCYAYEIEENIINKAPLLIFSNACTSAQTIYGQQGLVQAFLSSGTSTYIGTIWPVNDQLAGMIGEEFYRYIIHGQAVGEALRLARLNAHSKFGWTSLSWAAFIIYGDPASRIFH